LKVYRRLFELFQLKTINTPFRKVGRQTRRTSKLLSISFCYCLRGKKFVCVSWVGSLFNKLQLFHQNFLGHIVIAERFAEKIWKSFLGLEAFLHR